MIVAEANRKCLRQARITALPRLPDNRAKASRKCLHQARIMAPPRLPVNSQEARLLQEGQATAGVLVEAPLPARCHLREEAVGAEWVTECAQAEGLLAAWEPAATVRAGWREEGLVPVVG